jgi:glycosyltransferase involved in cell wall biosynthesis
MRILHVVPSYLPATRYGGPLRSVHGLCAGLARRGHVVNVMTTNVDGADILNIPVGRSVSLDGVDVTYFATGLGRRIFRSPSMNVALERRIADFDIVHLHSVFLWPTTAAAAKARRLGVPYILSPRGMLVPELIQRKSTSIKRLWIELFERRNLVSAGAIHVTSELETDGIRRLGLEVRRFVTIANGVELPPPAAAKKDAPTDAIPGPIVLFLGRINWKKGLDRLIPAMVQVPGAQLVIAGNDEESYTPKLRALAGQNGVADRTHFIGPLEGEAKWKVIATADVFVLPSHSENFGIAVLEAMACGVPVIVTPEVGLAHAIAETGAGLIVEGNPEDIGEAIRLLLTGPDLCRQMGRAGREVAVEQFSWNTISQQMEELYLSVLEAHASRQQTRSEIINA